MDVSYAVGAAPNFTGTVNGYAYRVEKVTDSALAADTLILDIDPPLKADVTTLVVLENVIAVVDRGTTWKP